MAVAIEQSNLLVVEGKSDQRFFRALIGHWGVRGIQIMPIGGKEKLRRNLKALVKAPGFVQVTFLGVIRDADKDPHAAFQSVCDALQAAGLPVPERPLVPVGEKLRVAVLVLPKEDSPGMLEDLCLRAVAEDPAIDCVEQYFECLKQKGLDLPKNISKAKVQVFLASREKAGLRLGEAAEAGYWPWDNGAFQQVKEFMRLFLESKKDESSC